MTIKIKKLNEYAVMPCKAHPTDAGLDLTATTREIKDGVVTYGTGLAMEIPKGYVGLIFPRSSNCKKDLLLSNSVGVIDSGYRGEVMLKFRLSAGFYFHNLELRLYEVGERIGQIIIMPYPNVEFEEADELSESDRGTGGYGSTGK